MATLTPQTRNQSVRKTLFPIGTDKALAYLADIMASADPSSSGEDALTVLNRKLEASNIVGSGTTTPVPDANSPFIWIRTDENSVRVKRTSGSTYSWSDPLFFGDYQSRIIYSADDNPGNPVISWNALNNNLDFGGQTLWALSVAGAKWFRILILPATSNAYRSTPNIRIGNPTAEDISYTPTGNGNIPSSVDNVDEALDVFHNATLGGGGSFTQQPSDWNAATGPTRILNKPIVPQIVELTNTRYLRPAANPANQPTSIGGLSQVGDYAIVSFNINQDLVNFSSTYNTDIFIETNAKITIEPGTVGTGHYALDARTGSGNTFQTPARGTVNFPTNNNEVSGYARGAGNIPRGTTSIQLRVTVTQDSSTNLLAGVDNFRAELRPDIKSDEILVNHGVIGNNINPSGLVTLDQFIGQVDEFPIQPSDFEDLEWPAAPSGIDDDGNEERSPVIMIHRNIQNVMNRPNRTFYAKISFKSAFTGSPTDGRSDVDFTHNVYTNVSSTALSTTSYSGQTATATTRNIEVDLPSNAASIRIGFIVPTGQADARLLITEYDLDIVERVGANLVTVDTSSFNGNLATTDDNVQKVAQKLDDLTVGAGASGSTYSQRTTLNNINRAANTIETVDLVSEQITLSSRLVDEGGERLNNPIAITVGYTITLPPALSGNVGTLFIRSVNNSENAGVTYAQQDISGVTSGNTININAILPHSANIPNTFYIILQIAVQPQAYAISLTNGIMYAERDLVGSIPSENIIIPEDTMANPVDFIGGLREVTGVSGVPNTPANVQQLAAKADYLFQQAYNPYQRTQNLDRFVVDRTVDTFDVGSTSALSNAIDIPNELRELETPIVIRIRAQVGPNPIGSNFTGTASLRNEANSATIGTPSSDEALSGTDLSVGDYINFERVLSVMEVAANARFRIRFLRTVNNGATAQFSDGFVYMEVSAGSGGGEATAEPEVIWQSGPSISDRTTATSASTNYSLISGRRFDQYRSIGIWYDSDGAAGSGLFSYVPEPAVSDMITNHGTGGRAGLIILEAFNTYKLIKPVTQTTFRIYEGSSNVGIRRIYGIP